MTLQEYRKANALTIDDLSDALDVPRNTVTSLLYHHRRPSIDLAHKIEDMTGGAVTTRDWSRPSKASTSKASTSKASTSKAAT